MYEFRRRRKGGLGGRRLISISWKFAPLALPPFSFPHTIPHIYHTFDITIISHFPWLVQIRRPWMTAIAKWRSWMASMWRWISARPSPLNRHNSSKWKWPKRWSANAKVTLSLFSLFSLFLSLFFFLFSLLLFDGFSPIIRSLLKYSLSLYLHYLYISINIYFYMCKILEDDWDSHFWQIEGGN